MPGANGNERLDRIEASLEALGSEHLTRDRKRLDYAEHAKVLHA